MTSVGRSIALCVVRWIAEQISAVLKALKALLLALIAILDAYVLALRAWLAQFDILSQIEKIAWETLQALVDAAKRALALPGDWPLEQTCPEFYSLLTDPISQLLDTSMSGLTVWREKYKNLLSFMDEVDLLIQYYDDIKQDLIITLDIVDDAIYQALMDEAAAIP